MCYEHLEQIQQNKLQSFIIGSIRNIFTKKNHRISDLSIIEIYNTAKKFVASKLDNLSIYNDTIEIGMESYIASVKGKEEFYSVLNQYISTQSALDDDIKQGIFYYCTHFSSSNLDNCMQTQMYVQI